MSCKKENTVRDSRPRNQVYKDHSLSVSLEQCFIGYRFNNRSDEIKDFKLNPSQDDRDKLCDQHIQVQAVVEVSTPKEMIKSKADVKRAQLFFSKRQKLEDVLKVVVPPALSKTMTLLHTTDS